MKYKFHKKSNINFLLKIIKKKFIINTENDVLYVQECFVKIYKQATFLNLTQAYKMANSCA